VGNRRVRPQWLRAALHRGKGGAQPPGTEAEGGCPAVLSTAPTLPGGTLRGQLLSRADCQTEAREKAEKLG
jgi:hypothetical protein